MYNLTLNNLTDWYDNNDTKTMSSDSDLELRIWRIHASDSNLEIWRILASDSNLEPRNMENPGRVFEFGAYDVHIFNKHGKRILPYRKART